MSEQNRKTLRSFYCRDYLWELFEVMSRDLGCSMDYLINEAMRHYARSRNYSLANARPQEPSQRFQQPMPPGVGPPPVPPASPTGGYTSAPPYGFQGAYGGRTGTNPPPPGYDQRVATQQRPPAFRAPPPAADPYAAPVPAPGYGGQGAYDARPPSAAPPPPPAPGGFAPAPPVPPVPPMPQRGAPAPAPSSRPRLYLIFQGQKYLVDKDKFLIGRGSKITDLTIRDGNISRKHAAVIYRSGKHFIKDLDSTNGIEYQGNRIDSKKIEEGDAFHVCDYEFRFTYRD